MAEAFEPIANRFLNGDVRSVVVVCPENERPLLGLGGFIDHKLKRPISQGLLTGFIKGTLGECTFVPARLEDKDYSIFVLGCGPVSKPGKRASLSPAALTELAKNLRTMKHFPVAISKSDLGHLDQNELENIFKGIEVVVGE